MPAKTQFLRINDKIIIIFNLRNTELKDVIVTQARPLTRIAPPNENGHNLYSLSETGEQS